MYFSDPFIGRVSDLEALSELINSGKRLLSIIGPPGIGKTRLIWELAAHYDRASVCLCPADDARTCEALFAKLGDVLGLSSEGAEIDNASRLGRELAARDFALVVLDGIEQLIPDIVPILASWQRAAPGTAFVVTSREMLQLREECVYELLPLELHERGSQPAEAVQLLLARSHGWRVGAAGISREEARIAKQIATQLDGIPLAIELAAARARALGLKAVLDRLPFGLDLLAHHARDRSHRQSTLRSAIAWSWDLLEPAEQELLARCSIFRGGFLLEAAEAIASPSNQRMLVLDQLQRLREKSLVRVLPLSDGQYRFDLYSSIRQYAREQLHAMGSSERVALLHARYFIRHAGADDGENLDVAIRCITSHPKRTAEDDAHACDSLVARKPLALASGDMDGYLSLLDLVIANDSSLTGSRRAAVHDVRGDIRRMRGQFAGAASDFAIALAEARDQNEEVLAGRIIRNLGALAFSQGELARARAHFDEALALHSRTGDRRFEGITLCDLGALDRQQGLLDDARSRFTTALEHLRAMGEARYELIAMCNVAFVDLDLGDTQRARSRFEDASSLSVALGSDVFGAYMHACLGMVAHLEGDLEGAIAFYEPSIATIHASGSRRFEAIYLGYCGVARFELGEHAGALESLRSAHQIAREVGDLLHESLFGGYLALVLSSHGEVAEARAQLATATALLENPRGAAFLTAVRHHLDGTAASAVDEQLGSFDLRIAQRAVERREAQTSELVVDRGGRWFSFAGRTVSCEKRPVVRRLLMCLIEQRLHAPGQAVSSESLRQAGWPGERVAARSASLRLRVSLTSLRNLGLRGILVAEDGGYLLATSVPVRVD